MKTLANRLAQCNGAVVAAWSNFALAAVLGLFVLRLPAFPEDAYTYSFDSYNDGCKQLFAESEVSSGVFASPYGPVIPRGRRGNFTTTFEKKPGQHVRLRYLNYAVNGFDFDLEIRASNAPARRWWKRFDSFRRPLYLGDLHGSAKIEAAFTGYLDPRAQSDAAFLNDQLEVILFDPHWAGLGGRPIWLYLCGMAGFLCAAVFGAGKVRSLAAGAGAQAIGATAMAATGIWAPGAMVGAALLCAAGGAAWKTAAWRGHQASMATGARVFAFGLLGAAAISVAALAWRAQAPQLAGDTPGYMNPARALLNGQGFEVGIERTPGYPLFITAALALLKGGDYAAAAHAQAALFGLLPILTLLAFWRGTGRFWAGWIAGLAVCLYLPLWILPSWILTEALATVWLMFTLWLFARAITRPGVRAGLAVGLAAGYLALIRPTFLLFWLFLAFFAALPAVWRGLRRMGETPQSENRAPWAKSAAAIAMGAGALLFAWSLHNEIRHGFFGVSVKAGKNVWSHLMHYPGLLPARDAVESDIRARVQRRLEDTSSPPGYADIAREAEAACRELEPDDPWSFLRRSQSIFRAFFLAHPREFVQSVWQSLKDCQRPNTLAPDMRFEAALSYAAPLWPFVRLVNETPALERIVNRIAWHGALIALGALIFCFLPGGRRGAFFLCAVIGAILYVMAVSAVIMRLPWDMPRYQAVVRPLTLGGSLAAVWMALESGARAIQARRTPPPAPPVEE